MLLPGCVDYAIRDSDVESLPPVVVEERFVQAPLPEIDVLFVVDSTGSMADEQASLAAAASTFLDVLDDLQLTYQVGVTSTDPADDGALRGRPWIITGGSDSGSESLATALQVGTASAPPAAGFHTAALALDDALGLNRGFRRAGAGLHVVFVSDGDDQSDTWLGGDPESAFLAVLEADEEESGRLARVSAVVGDVPDGCRTNANSALPGTRYAAVAEATGGIVESICAADFAAIATALGGAAADWPTRFPLQAAPVDGSALVEVDGVRVESGWWLDTVEPALVFNLAPPADAEISVVYTLAESE
ncbi:MAG: vWA domain-containing protein [Pseudomonadota bacterium]|nr:vWA domain-containing protein [Pseudomonadota bacterium]